MAGSWQRMTTKSGKFRNNESFCGMIENLGDAYEAAEQCYGMVQVLAEQLANITGELREDLIKSARARYQAGLSIGGVQKP
jgi:hypothetical protein